MSEFTLKNGMKLYYQDFGSGQPVILMHGWTSSHKIYSEPVKRLNKKARCIIYDHRGHGGSRDADQETVTMETLASDLNELIEGLSLSKVTLVGWSMGAGTAMTYIRNFGCSALRHVVLCDMTPRQINDTEWKLGLYQGKYTKEDMEELIEECDWDWISYEGHLGWKITVEPIIGGRFFDYFTKSFYPFIVELMIALPFYLFLYKSNNLFVVIVSGIAYLTVYIFIAYILFKKSYIVSKLDTFKIPISCIFNINI